MTITSSDRAVAIFYEHIALAKVDGFAFRSKVKTQIMAEFGCTETSASTRYNTARKIVRSRTPELIEGLGRPEREVITPRTPHRTPSVVLPDLDDDIDTSGLFSVIENVYRRGNSTYAGRTQCFMNQGDASECFDMRVAAWPKATWVLITGMGPIHGDLYKLRKGEREIKRHNGGIVALRKYDFVLESGEHITIPAVSHAEAVLELESQHGSISFKDLEEVES